jgi:glycosyltransferase involved in cell wall biosynthesis
MDIFMPIAQFDLGHGGAEIQALRLARQFVSRGHRVELLTSRPRGFPKTASIEGVSVRRFFTFGNARGLWRLAPYSLTWSIFRYLRRQATRVHVVHAQQAFHPAFAAIMARRRGGGPVLVHPATAGVFGDLTQMREGRATLPAFSSHLLKRIITDADAFVAVSPAIEVELLDAGVEPARIARLPHGVDLPSLSIESRLTARQSLALGPDQRVVVYVGRAGIQKGADILVQAWKRVATGRSNVRLFLLGEGLRGMLVAPGEEWPLPSIVAPGRVLNVESYLLSADIFVLPSRGEGLSSAILEAMAHNLPCIVSDLPANRALVENGVTGLLVPAGDAEGLARVLAAALDDVPSLRAMATAARHKVEASFGIEQVAQQYLELYRRLLEQRAPTPEPRVAA